MKAAMDEPDSASASASPRPRSNRAETSLVQTVDWISRAPIATRVHSKRPVEHGAGGRRQQRYRAGLDHQAGNPRDARPDPVDQHADAQIEEHADQVRQREPPHHLGARPAEFLLERDDERPDGIGLQGERRIADGPGDRQPPEAPPFRYRALPVASAMRSSLPLAPQEKGGPPLSRGRPVVSSQLGGDYSPKLYFRRKPHMRGKLR